jgi:hypothetical protein
MIGVGFTQAHHHGAEAGLVEERPFRLTAGDAVALPQAVKLFDD